MGRDTKTVGKPGKKRRPTEATAKPRRAPKPKHASGPSAVNRESRLARLTRELREAMERQTATAGILQIIANSPSDVQPVFEAVAERAMRLLDCWSVIVTRFDGECFQFGAARGALPDTEQFVRQRYQSMRPDRASLLGRSLTERTVVSSADALTEPDPQLRDYARKRGLRAILIVPLLRDDKVEGALILTRAEPGLFAPREIELVQTFADQAVIAIQNARLFNETREALERQTASADILRIIGSSPTDVQPVFDAIVASLLRLFGTQFAAVQLLHDGIVTMPAVGGKAGFERLAERFPRPLDDTTIGGLVMLSKQTRQFVAHEDSTTPAGTRQFARDFGFNSVLFTPMIHDGQVIGSVGTAHPDAKVFDPHQIALIETFADQAVIAIQNVRMFDEVQARTRDLTEALQQQTGTADVLKVISRSAFDLNMVTTAILQAAAQLCRAPLATLHLRDGDVCRLVTQFGLPEAFEQVSRDNPIPARYPLHSHRQVRAGEFAQFTDAWSDSDYLYKAVAKLGGYRAIIVIPMMREGELVGIFSLARPEPEPFTPGQIKLVQTFADQAAIAIENARLFNELRQRTDDLGESLQQQTATADVLKVISRSVFDLQTVLDTLVESAYKLCGANLGLLYLRGEEAFECKAIAGAGVTEASALFKGRPIRAGRGTAAERVILTGEVQSITDFFEDPEMDPKIREAIRNANGSDSTIGQIRSTLAVPMTRDNAVIGVMVIGCSQTGPFPQRQIELLQTFADQAVIAIENVRLFDEVQAKTRDLSESLQQQTATADVLKVISRSAFDLKSVLTTLIESAKSLCGASLGIICLRDGEVMRLRAESGCTPAFLDFMEANPIRPGRATMTGRVLMDAKPVHVADVQHDPEYNFGQAPTIGAYRAVLAVPLMRDGAVEGVLLLGRPEPGPFSQRQIDLVQTFADQAVIAIENARLFNETKQALERQTATAGILKVIASSPSDVQPVFEAIVRSANTLVGGFSSTVFRFIDGIGHLKAFTPTTPAADEVLQATFPLPVSDFLPFQMAQAGEATQFADTETLSNEILNIARARGFRSILFAPMMSDGVSIGSIAVTRVQPGAFADHHVQLLQTFADQAVIAIENVRLFEQVQARTRELSSSLDELRTAQDRLVQTEKLASLGQLTAGIAHEIKNPLNFVNNFSALSAELIDELNDVLKPAALDDKVREEIDELTQMLKGNLEKVVQHGKRADSIVKNMLLHSREGAGEHRPADINAIVEESLNLAYHGARAEKSGFNITLRRDLDPAAGMIDLYPQEMTRVFLNLISNGFYAAAKRKEAGDEGFEPTLSATTKSLGNIVEIRIRDNGTGIPPEVKERMFNPFFTTKPAGEGTGLGLSMSHDIVVKQHGGKIEVDTMPGAFTEFIITLPRAAAAQRQAGGTN